MHHEYRSWYEPLEQLAHSVPASAEPSFDPTPPMRADQQIVDYMQAWCQRQFLPLDGHWVVRWARSDPQTLQFTLWLAQQLPRRGAFAPVSPAEAWPMTAAVATVVWTSTPTGYRGDWHFPDGSVLPVSHAAVTDLGLLTFQDADPAPWRPVLLRRCQSLPRSQWLNPLLERRRAIRRRLLRVAAGVGGTVLLALSAWRTWHGLSTPWPVPTPFHLVRFSRIPWFLPVGVGLGAVTLAGYFAVTDQDDSLPLLPPAVGLAGIALGLVMTLSGIGQTQTVTVTATRALQPIVRQALAPSSVRVTWDSRLLPSQILGDLATHRPLRHNGWTLVAGVVLPQHLTYTWRGADGFLTPAALDRAWLQSDLQQVLQTLRVSHVPKGPSLRYQLVETPIPTANLAVWSQIYGPWFPGWGSTTPDPKMLWSLWARAGVWPGSDGRR